MYNMSFHNSKFPAISGVKRARVTFEEQQPSVHVTYNSLTRLVGVITILMRDQKL